MVCILDASFIQLLIIANKYTIQVRPKWFDFVFRVWNFGGHQKPISNDPFCKHVSNEIGKWWKYLQSEWIFFTNSTHTLFASRCLATCSASSNWLQIINVFSFWNGSDLIFSANDIHYSENKRFNFLFKLLISIVSIENWTYPSNFAISQLHYRESIAMKHQPKKPIANGCQ